MASPSAEAMASVLTEDFVLALDTAAFQAPTSTAAPLADTACTEARSRALTSYHAHTLPHAHMSSHAHTLASPQASAAATEASLDIMALLAMEGTECSEDKLSSNI